MYRGTDGLTNDQIKAMNEYKKKRYLETTLGPLKNNEEYAEEIIPQNEFNRNFRPYLVQGEHHPGTRWVIRKKQPTFENLKVPQQQGTVIDPESNSSIRQLKPNTLEKVKTELNSIKNDMFEIKQLMYKLLDKSSNG